MRRIKVDTKSLGIAISRHREDCGLSLRQLGDRTGISPSTLSRVENDEGQIHLSLYAQLVDYLKLPFDRFLIGFNSNGLVTIRTGEPIPTVVRAFLKQDPKITSPDVADALAELFEVAYRRFAREDK